MPEVKKPEPNPAMPVAPTTHQEPPQLVKPGQVFSDLAKPSTPTISPVQATNPANSFHAGPVSAAPGGVLDLRRLAPKPEPIATTPTSPSAEALVVPAPPPVKVESPQPLPPKPVASPTPTATPKPTLDLAQSTSVTSTPDAKPATPEPTTATSSSITKFVRPAAAATSAPQAETKPAETPMPQAVATQVQAMQKLAATASSAVNVPADRENAFKMAMSAPSTGPGLKSVAAATLAIAIMGGYIWLNNYNSLAVKAAGQKAGIQASMPSYIPSSYSLSGPIAYSTGAVTMKYKSPSNEDTLQIEQHRTDWTSNSLLEFYVNRQTGNYVSVQSQGLTIYVYNNSQATWVNKGLQYIISGNTKLSRADLLKIAQSL